MDVRLPDGTIVKNVPEGTTKAQLMAKVGKAVQPEFSEDQQAALRSKGLMPSKYSKEEEAAAIPVILGTAGALAAPGPGWAALGLSSLGAGAGAGGGELLRQFVTKEEIDPLKAGKEGLKAGAGNLVGGTVVKGLGKAASTFFGSKLSPDEAMAQQFAQADGAPFPLSIAKPSLAQRAADKFALGKLGNQQQANKVTQYLNQKVGSLTEKAAVFDDVAAQGQGFFRNLLEPGETKLRATFDDYAAAIGPDARVPISRTQSALRNALDELQKTGDTKNPLAVRIRSMLKVVGNSDLTPAQLDGLMFGLTKDTYKRGTNESVVGAGERVMEALAKDMDEFGQNFGKNFLADFSAAKAERAGYRKLIREVPQIAQLSKEFGEQGATKGSIDWMNRLFNSGNGKALSKIREVNPALYHDLADSWIAANVNRFAHFNPQMHGRTLDGAGLRQWVEANGDTIKQVLGKDQFKALDNFSLYAKTMTGSNMAKAGEGIKLQNLAFSGAVGGPLGFVNPWLLVPTEGAAFVLARGLSDPSSTLFKLFASDATKAAVRAAGRIGGQQAAQ